MPLDPSRVFLVSQSASNYSSSTEKKYAWKKCGNYGPLLLKFLATPLVVCLNEKYTENMRLKEKIKKWKVKGWWNRDHGRQRYAPGQLPLGRYLLKMLCSFLFFQNFCTDLFLELTRPSILRTLSKLLKGTLVLWCAINKFELTLRRYKVPILKR